ncbi:MAG: amidohydrolase family protein, partial [Brevundimonas sp.]
MKKLALIVTAAVLAATSAQARQAPAVAAVSAEQPTTFVQVGRLLADPASGRVLRDKTLVIRGNQVVEIRDGFVGDGNVVDLRGAFVLPGLIDSHVHLTSQQSPSGRLDNVTESNATQAMIGARYARRTLNAGFTTVADLGASNE